ncbi:MAG: glycosyltransferase [Anaerolineaceae bacterium]|jgi:UDP:flavonoid glycosyltransferase YjiC (YdhE family)|nr:glycosyltransferase [Chloroflexota bacterium]
MKKIAMFTMGTRGDIQPYIFLSRELIRNGYDVTLGSHPCWKNLVEEAGIHFEPIGPDIDIDKEAAIIRGKTSNPALSMLRMMNFVFKIIQNSTHQIFEVCKGKDLIIVSHSQMGATEAEVLGIPTINVTLQKEMIAEKLKPQSFWNKLIGQVIGKQVAKPYNKIRKVYGLKPIQSSDEIISRKLNLIPISKHVLERNPYWEEQHILTGYWYEDEENYVPDEKLAAFLASGEKPILLALGAMSFEEESEKEKLDMFVNAFSRTGYRAIIQGFQKTLQNYELPETMISCGSVPHSFLFKHCLFVIHHCGFGTAAATMIYGIPSIPVPHVLDQMGFAMQLYDINVATKPLKSKDLNESSIYEAILDMQSNFEEKKKNAELISAKIKEEGGVEEAVRLIEKVMEK